MAAFYPTSNPQVDNGLSAPTYLQDQKFAPYSESPIIHGNNMMMYLNPTSSAGPFSEISHGTSMSERSEMMFIPPTDTISHSVAEELQLASRSQHDIINGKQNLHGLSLSLSTQMSTALPTPVFQHQYSNIGLSSVLGKHMRNSGYGNYDSIGFGDPNNLQYSLNPKAVGFSGYQYEQAGFAHAVLKSKYLKPAQLLLDEIVNVREAFVKHESGKDPNMNKVEEESIDSKDKSLADPDGNASTSASQEISATERQELKNKLDKLLAMLDEVDGRYKQYYYQMQILVSSFDMVAGSGAAKPYTALALKTISRHFRSLRDSINDQIRAARQSLGEQDTGPGGVIPRLRYVDQQLRQQRALQQFGMMRNAWRPQRGLPETAVTILRAWLFEHFLHPYPKDSEKIMLARQTGLTRGQVANWFINARVRLWKPMVEEMYNEEFGSADRSSKSPLENASKPRREKSWASEDRREEPQANLASMAESGRPGPSHDRPFTSLNYHNPENSEIVSHGFYPHDHNTLLGCQVPELGNYGMDHNKVSLALGLRRVEGDAGDGSGFRPGGSTENNASGNGLAEFSYIEPVNQQHRFDTSHLLNDFVA